jgi:predicted permease
MALDLLRDDLRQARRSLARDRGVALVVVLVLALGIGATTAIFSLVHSVVLRPLAYRDPDRLFVVREGVNATPRGAATLPANVRHFLAWREQTTTFEAMALVKYSAPSLTGFGEPRRVEGANVTAGFFGLLGVHASRGRTFAAGEDATGRDRVVVVSDTFWRQLGADVALVGRRLMLDGESLEVVGILPPDFRFGRVDRFGVALTSGEVEVFRPWPLETESPGLTGDHNYLALARLRAGVSVAHGEDELDVVQARIAAQLTGDERLTLTAGLRPLHDEIVGASRRGLWMVLAAVAGILLVACGNVSHLLLVRAASRRRDAAVRAAMGASPARLARQSLVESLVLAAAGGAAGTLLAVAGLRVLVERAPADLPRLAEVSLDGRALAFSLAVSLLTGVLCGLGPALRARRADPNETLSQSGRSGADGPRAARARHALVVLEVASSTAIVVVAALLVTSFLRLSRVDRGFEVEHVLTADLPLRGEIYQAPERRSQLLGDVASAMKTLPGVTAAGFVTRLPLQGDAWSDVVSLPGDERPYFERPMAAYRAIGGDYFRALGMTMVRGRAIGERDRPRPVAVISAETARRLWPGQDPIGRLFRRGNPDDPPFEIVGVVADVRSRLDRDPAPMVYVPYWRRHPSMVSLAVRTVGEPADAAAALKAAVWRLDPSLPISRLQTFAQVERRHLAERRFQTLLVLLFGAVSLLLASLGAYSCLAFGVARRRTELGVRLALGARPAQVGWLVLKQGLRPVALGILTGLGLALALGRVLSSLLFGVGSHDPATLAVVCAVMVLSGAAACWIPTRRATRLDPAVTLRGE